MGISGLLPLLKSITRPVHISELANLTVAIDAYVWLHRGAYSCSKELIENIPTDKYIRYVMNFVQLLLQHNVKPLLVFDGANLPVKGNKEEERRERRELYKKQAVEYLKQGNNSAAHDCFQKAVDITPTMAYNIIKVLKQLDIEFIVAPYEADAQLAYLAQIGYVDAVISEDSDLLPYGATRVIFKMDKFGNGQEIRMEDLGNNKELNFKNFTRDNFRHMCILSGCDYVSNISGIGVKKAHTFVLKHRSPTKVFKALKDAQLTIPNTYELDFKRADLTFLHQWVYDPLQKKIVPLNQYPENVDVMEMVHLGLKLDDDVARLVAEGLVHPTTKEPFESQANLTVNVLQYSKHNPGARRNSVPAPAQHNKISNYFSPATTPKINHAPKSNPELYVKKRTRLVNTFLPQPQHQTEKFPHPQQEKKLIGINTKPEKITPFEIIDSDDVSAHSTPDVAISDKPWKETPKALIVLKSKYFNSGIKNSVNQSESQIFSVQQSPSSSSSSTPPGSPSYSSQSQPESCLRPQTQTRQMFRNSGEIPQNPALAKIDLKRCLSESQIYSSELLTRNSTNSRNFGVSRNLNIQFECSKSVEISTEEENSEESKNGRNFDSESMLGRKRPHDVERQSQEVNLKKKAKTIKDYFWKDPRLPAFTSPFTKTGRISLPPITIDLTMLDCPSPSSQATPEKPSSPPYDPRTNFMSADPSFLHTPHVIIPDSPQSVRYWGISESTDTEKNEKPYVIPNSPSSPWKCREKKSVWYLGGSFKENESKKEKKKRWTESVIVPDSPTQGVIVHDRGEFDTGTKRRLELKGPPIEFKEMISKFAFSDKIVKETCQK